MKKKDFDRKDNYEYEEDYDNSEEYDEDSEYSEDDEDVEEAPARPEKTLKVIFTGVIIACIVLGILIAVFFAIKNKKNDSDSTTVNEEITTQKVVDVISPEDKYTPGTYTVKIGNNATLNLRKEPESKKGNIVKKVRNGEKLVITEIFFDENAEEDKAYWGKTNYDGYELWVLLNYLVKDYDNNVPSEPATSAKNETTTKIEKPSEEISTKKPAAEEKTTAKKPTEEKTTAVNTPEHIGPSVPGEYTVTADEFLRLRSNHSVASTDLIHIPKDTKIKVTEVYHDKDSNDKYSVYWGKTTYGGDTGWVAMGYLK